MKLKPILALITVMAALAMTGGIALPNKLPAPDTSGPGAKGSKAGDKEDTVRPAAPSAGGVASLTGISIQPAPDGKGTSIAVSTTQPTRYRYFYLAHPRRVVLDLEGARNATDRWRYSTDLPFLARVRLGRFSPKYGGVIRVVADLEGNPVCTVRKDGTGFRINLEPRVRKPDAGLDYPAAEDLETAPEGSARSASGQREAARQVSELENTSRARTAEKPIPRSRKSWRDNFSARIRVPAPPEKTATTAMQRVTVSLRPEHEASQAAKVMAGNATAHAIGLGVQTASLRQSPDEKGKYTGKRISLNLKDVDLKDFFRLIHEISGLNVIVDSDVSGSVTMVLDDVPWDQALDIVLKNNGLGERLEGTVLRIAKISTLVAEQQEVRKLATVKEEAAPLMTVFRPINYAKAATIAGLLKTWVGGGALSSRGSVLVDQRTNTLIISDIGSRIPAIESVINKLDKKAQQVSIQARIIMASSDFARNLSTALSFAQKNASGSLTTAGATGSQVTGQPLSPPTVITSPATGFGVFVLSNLGANYAINAAIAAAETRDQAKTISRPSIVTQNNIEGTVVQGTQIPIQTTINNTISIQYVQASLQLQVTPQVTDDGHVFLTINIQNSSPGPALTLAGPTINTQSATTQVLVPERRNGGVWRSQRQHEVILFHRGSFAWQHADSGTSVQEHQFPEEQPGIALLCNPKGPAFLRQLSPCAGA